MTELEFYSRKNALNQWLVSEKLLLSLSLLGLAATAVCPWIHLTICLVALALVQLAGIPMAHCMSFYLPPLTFMFLSLLVARLGSSPWLPPVTDFAKLAAQLLALSPLLLTTPLCEVFGFLRWLGLPIGLVQLGHDMFVLLSRSWHCFGETERAAELRKGRWHLQRNTQLAGLAAARLQRRIERRIGEWEKALTLRGGSAGLLVVPERCKPRGFFWLFPIVTLAWISLTR